MLSKDTSKALFLLICGLVLTSLNFWLTSRYPDLGTKSALGGDAPLSGLGFGPLYEISPNSSIYEKLFYGTVNWLDTNRRGMTFAFILSAFLLSLLPLLETKKFESGFGNALLGLLMGTPLGLCVNCTAPIARAMQICGMSLETALAFLVSSPTMNIVILAMVFALFPLYIALHKIFFTLLFVLIVIPLACRYLFNKEIALHKAKQDICVTVPSFIAPVITGGWPGALKWSLTAYIKNFIKILILTGPLMIVAGFLGTLIITLLPWEIIRTLNESLPSYQVFGLMVGIAIIGALLPAPMAFDIAMSSALLQAGVPMIYVAVFLFTLGSYSIYAFMIVWQSISLRVASFLLVTTVILGLLMGLSTIYFEQHYKNSAKRKVAFIQTGTQKDSYLDPIIKRSDQAFGFSSLQPELNKNKVTYMNVTTAGDLKIEAAPFLKAENAIQNHTSFTRIYGEDLGLLQPYRVSYITGLDIVPRITTSIASGDVHNDGWEDILVLGDHETTPNLILYTNIGGKRFLRQQIPAAEDVVLVALADLDGDGWLDIVYATYDGQSYAIYNKNGAFLDENRKLILSVSPATTNSLGFGDLDKNGSLDIVTGNWSVGTLFLNDPASKDIALLSQEGEYISVTLPGLSGETLTSLIWDFNGDSNPDIFLGNDNIVEKKSDLILLGDGKGKFSLPNKDLAEAFSGGQSTMSIDVADYDNDRVPEFFIGQIAYIGNYMRAMSKITERQISYKDFCNKDSLPPERTQSCMEEVEFKIALAKISNFVVDACKNLTNPDYKSQCQIHLANYRDYCAVSIFEDREVAHTDNIKASKRYADFCIKLRMAANRSANRQLPKNTIEYHLTAANPSLGNVLLDDKKSGTTYEEVAKESGIAYGGWTWNAKFSDLDNDGWQDIYVVNGYVRATVVESKIFYRNLGNGGFEDATKTFNLEDYSTTSAYTYVDFDHDGDLDIVTVPVDGPIKVFKNTIATAANSIQFQLIDRTSANTSAIGAKIVIHYYLEGKPKSQVRYIKASGGYKSYDPTIAHFGLGSVGIIENIEIEWPDGHVSSIQKNLAVNARYKILRN